MNYDQFFSDVKKWLIDNNQAAANFGFNTSEYWQWVIKTSGNLCNYYKNNPIAICIMSGLINYLEKVSGGTK